MKKDLYTIIKSIFAGLLYSMSIRNYAYIQKAFISKLLLVISMLLLPYSFYAQIITIADSLTVDTAAVDTLKKDNLGIKISKDGLTEILVTKAKDSAVIDIRNNQFFLYGDAAAQYQDMDVKAGVINFNQGSGIVDASAIKDSTGKIISTQSFQQGTENFSFEALKYNFNSKRAIVSNARSQYGEGFVFSEQVKRNEDESIYGYRNLYTTCELDTPHFGIRAKKIKVVPGKIIASGSAHLEFNGIPTPLVLPFGIFPIQQKQSSGFIMPSYTMEARRGLGLQRGGYYFAINDYVGSTLQFDIFSKGSWAVVNSTQYANKYKYNGQLQFGYNFTKTGESYDPNAEIRKDFNIQWNHAQDQRARPGTSFGASVNIVTNNYNKLNGMDMNQILNNSFSSSISYSKTWVGKPFLLTGALRHSQNTQSGLVTLNLPDLNFSVTQFNPFQFRKVVSNPRWYEKITTSYSTQLTNQLSFYDSTFHLNNLSASSFNNAMVHNLNLSASYNVLRYFNWNFNIPYTEFWHSKQFLSYYDTLNGVQDTMNNQGFYASRQFEISTRLSTRLYGIKMFKTGRIAGIRHVVTPDIGLRYMPGFARAPFNYFVYGKSNAQAVYDYLSPYANSTYTPLGGPTNANPVGAVTFNVGNTLAMKVRGKDSADATNINIIDRFNIGTNYNMFADSNKLSNINMYMGSRIKDLVTISAGAQFDPYKYENRRRTRHYLWDTDNKLARFQNGQVAIGLNYTSRKQNQAEQDQAVEENEEVKRLLDNGGYDTYYDFNIPFDFQLAYSMNAARDYRNSDNGKILLNHSLTFGGQFQLTENWRIAYQSGYNFTQKQMSMTSINISRDIHCWQMNLNIIPFGTYRSFNFALNVKSAVLQDLRLIKRKSYLDN